MSAEFEVQKALYSALTALGLRVYDRAPQAADGGSTATFPYVEVGTIILTPWDDAGSTGFDYLARIHVRSRAGSMKEAKDIQGQIYERLHRGALTITGYHHVTIQRERSEVMTAPDGQFHGVCEYRGLIDKT